MEVKQNECHLNLLKRTKWIKTKKKKKRTKTGVVKINTQVKMKFVRRLFEKHTIELYRSNKIL
jgi:hypothetical protein